MPTHQTTTVNWPEQVDIDDRLYDSLADLADQVRHDDPTLAQKFDLNVVGTGQGRVVYDITEYASIPAVLRVARRDIGTAENEAETTSRDSFSTPFRNRLVPVLDYGHGFGWTVQPKCDSIPILNKEPAMEQLEQLAEQAGVTETREIHRNNIGLFDSTPVLFDFGGLD